VTGVQTCALPIFGDVPHFEHVKTVGAVNYAAAFPAAVVPVPPWCTTARQAGKAAA